MAKKMIQVGDAYVSQADMLKFIKELHEGTHKKAQCTLQKGKNSFCCLGVGCKLFAPKEPVDKNGKLTQSMPGYDSPQWLQNLDRDLYHKTGEYAASLNDGADILGFTYKGNKRSLTHPEIADILQAVYIEGVDFGI